jgi:hypothetical protein
VKEIWFFARACLLLGTLAIRPALANNIVVGVNVFDEGFIPQAAQDDELAQLTKNGVKTIRTGLGNSSLNFITQAYQHGIGTIVIVYPFYGSKAKSKGSWSQVPLSEIKPEEFREWLKPKLDKLEAAGVQLTAIELGNEINTSGYNGDIPKPGTGRVLGLSDLNNPNDPEGVAIAAGYRAYLQIMATLKDMRDQSQLNKTTPILSAGLADWGLPSAKSWNKTTGVSIPDTIDFLRQNGMDKLADGYGVHVYPSSDPHTPLSARIAQLQQDIFAGARQGAKPCWLTEWGISISSHPSSNNEEVRAQVIEDERRALAPFISQGRLAAIIYFPWRGLPNQKEDPMAIFRSGVLSNSGKLALSPM